MLAVLTFGCLFAIAFTILYRLKISDYPLLGTQGTGQINVIENRLDNPDIDNIGYTC
jgi:hypothetical protein